MAVKALPLTQVTSKTRSTVRECEFVVMIRKNHRLRVACVAKLIRRNTMEAKRPSRTEQVELDECLKHFNDKYDMILTAARRTRKLQKNTDPWGPMVTPIDALLEAQRGELNRDDYLKPNNGMSIEEYYRRRRRNSSTEITVFDLS